MSANLSEDELCPSASCSTQHLSSNTSINSGYFPPFIIHPSFPSRSLSHTSSLFRGHFHLSLQLCVCFYFFCTSLMVVLFSFFFPLLFRITRLMIKEYSSPAAFQTNGAHLTIMENITAYIKYFANCHHRFIFLIYLFFR